MIAELQSYSRELAAADPIAALTERLRVPSDLRRSWPAAPGEPAELPAEPGALLALGRAGGWVTAVRDDNVSTMRPGSDRNSS